jgi:hypothetical protein
MSHRLSPGLTVYAVCVGFRSADPSCRVSAAELVTVAPAGSRNLVPAGMVWVASARAVPSAIVVPRLTSSSRRHRAPSPRCVSASLHTVVCDVVVIMGPRLASGRSATWRSAWPGAACWSTPASAWTGVATLAEATVPAPIPSAATEVTRMRARCCWPPVANRTRSAPVPRVTASRRPRSLIAVIAVPTSTRTQPVICAQASQPITATPP